MFSLQTGTSEHPVDKCMNLIILFTCRFREAIQYTAVIFTVFILSLSLWELFVASLCVWICVCHCVYGLFQHMMISE